MSERPGQPGGKRATNRAKRIASLSEAALRLFLEQGIEATTIEAITAAAGTAKGSFYRYFDDKEDLVHHLARPVIEALEEALDHCAESLDQAPNPEEMFAAYQVLAAELTAAFLGHSDVVRLYLQESRGPSTGARRPVAEVRALIGRRTLELTAIARRHDLLATAVDPRVSALATVGAIEHLLMALLAGEDIGNPLSAADSLIRLMLDGLRRR